MGYHFFHTYIPSAMIVVMSWISFWIKPEAIPARVTLGVTSLLTLGEYCMQQLQRNLLRKNTIDYRCKDGRCPGVSKLRGKAIPRIMR